jgi:addiction module RelE/StbE family toxin
VWTISEHRRLAKEISTAPLQVRRKYEFWKNVVRHGGPEALAALPGFGDEPLAGQWQGFRSCRLNLAYRVIYRAQKDHLLVFVERVSKHDYRP